MLRPHSLGGSANTSAPALCAAMQVPVEPHLQVRVQWDQSERASMIDTAPARAVQIAVWTVRTLHRYLVALLAWEMPLGGC